MVLPHFVCTLNTGITPLPRPGRKISDRVPRLSRPPLKIYRGRKPFRASSTTHETPTIKHQARSTCSTVWPRFREDCLSRCWPSLALVSVCRPQLLLSLVRRSVLITTGVPPKIHLSHCACGGIQPAHHFFEVPKGWPLTVAGNFLSADTSNNEER